MVSIDFLHLLGLHEIEWVLEKCVWINPCGIWKLCSTHQHCHIRNLDYPPTLPMRHCCDIRSLLQIGSMQCCMQPCRACWMETESRTTQVQKDDRTECNADGSCLTEPGVNSTYWCECTRSHQQLGFEFFFNDTSEFQSLVHRRKWYIWLLKPSLAFEVSTDPVDTSAQGACACPCTPSTHGAGGIC
jgi:hypothetical protein